MHIDLLRGYMMKILSCLIVTLSITNVSAQSFMERMRDKYLYGDTEIEGVEQSYDKAEVFIPNKFFTTVPSKIDVNKKYPVVIYLHGCTGITQHDYQWAKFISNLGYIVIQPNSLARPNTKIVCDPKTFKSEPGLATGKALMFRQQEIKYALSQIRISAWADTSNVVLMGHSQGGVSAALNKINEFKRVIISGWSCTHSLTGGIKSEKNVPVLSITYDNDPWYSESPFKGSCADYAHDRESFKQVNLQGSYHNTYDNYTAREEVQMFLKLE
jgi:dienelactone hydrolase